MRRAGFAILVVAASACADFIGPDPAGAGGAGASTGTSSISATTTSVGGGGGAGGGDGGGGSGGGPTGPITGLAVGKTHGCAVRDGDVWCWGTNMFQAIGDPGVGGCTSPRRVTFTGDFTAVGVGDEHTCALRSSGAISCWGTNSHGQVAADGTAREAQPTPTPVSLNFLVQQLSVGAKHNCAVTSGNEVYCWGDNSVRQSAPGSGDNLSPPSQYFPLNPSIGTRQVAAGIDETCVFNANQVECFGANEFIHGRDMNACMGLGPGAFVVGLLASTISVGADEACARAAGGEYECWGTVISGACTANWCSNMAYEGCITNAGNARAVASTAGYRCIVDIAGVTCVPTPTGNPMAAPVNKIPAELNMGPVNLLAVGASPFGDVRGMVCVSDSAQVKCWGPAQSAVLCDNNADVLVPLQFIE